MTQPAGRPLADLFVPEPAQWGLRGDPAVWRAMRALLAEVAVPDDPADAAAMLHSAFEQVVGARLDDPGLPPQVHRPDLDDGGLSAGTVDIETWRQQLMPLLTERAGRPAPPA